METTQVVNFRREVLRRIAEYTWKHMERLSAGAHL